MSPRAIRQIAVVVSLAGIAGIIYGSIADNNGLAVTAGLVTAVGALVIILVTSVAGPDRLRKDPSPVSSTRSERPTSRRRSSDWSTPAPTSTL